MQPTQFPISTPPTSPRVLDQNPPLHVPPIADQNALANSLRQPTPHEHLSAIIPTDFFYVSESDGEEIKLDDTDHKLMLCELILESWIEEASPEERDNRTTASNRILDCIEKGSPKLDISNLNLSTLPEFLSYCSHIQSFSCINNQLTHLDLSACPQLKVLHCSKNPLMQLDASFCPKLENLWTTKCTDLTSLNISTCTKLDELLCEKNNLTELNLSGCTNLIWVDCSENNLNQLNVSGLTLLHTFICDTNRLTELDLTHCRELYDFNCGSNQLTHLDLSFCPKLWDLKCYNNQLTHLNLSNCMQLHSVEAQSNALTEVSLAHINNFKWVDLSDNPALDQIEWFEQSERLNHLALEGTAIRWQDLPLVLRQRANLHIDIRPTHHLNAAQNTHTASVHAIATQNALQLKQQNSFLDYEKAFQHLSEWITSLPVDNASIINGKANDAFKNAAAQRFCEAADFESSEDPSEINRADFLILVWAAIHSAPQREKSISVDDARLAVRDTLYEIQRGYNFDDQTPPNDNGEEDDRPICSAGSFNKISEKIVSVLKNMEFVFVNLQSFTNTLRNTITQHIPIALEAADDKDDLIEAVKKNNNLLTQTLWNRIQDSVKQIMLDEFGNHTINGKTASETFEAHAQFEGNLEYLEVPLGKRKRSDDEVNESNKAPKP